AVQNLPTLDQAFRTADALLQVESQHLEDMRIASRQQTVGRISAPWGSATDLVASDDLDVLTLDGAVVRAELRAEVPARAVAAGTRVGSLHVTTGLASFELPVLTSGRIEAPGPLWRAIRVG